MIGRVGLTGNMGSGKSYVCRVFESIGIPVYYADTEAARIMTCPETIAEVSHVFGRGILSENGLIDRKKLASVVFNDAKKLNRLNALIHPRVREDSERWHIAQRKAGSPYTIQEAAVLFESGHFEHFDCIIVVVADQETRIKRVIQRDGISREQVMQRMQHQLSQDEKISRADFVIHNQGNELLIPRVLDIDAQLRRNFSAIM